MNWTRAVTLAVLVGAAGFGLGCGKREAGETGSGKTLSAQEKREKVEALKKELERLKAEIAELQRSAQQVENELKQARAPEGK